MDKVFKHKEVTGEILKAAFEVHNSLGCGFLEKVYENTLAGISKTRDIIYR